MPDAKVTLWLLLILLGVTINNQIRVQDDILNQSYKVQAED